MTERPTMLPMLSVIAPVIDACPTLPALLDSLVHDAAIEYLFAANRSQAGTTNATVRLIQPLVDAGVGRWFDGLDRNADSTAEISRSLYGTWNLGIEASRGQWLHFIGTDDRYEPAALARLPALLADLEWSGPDTILCRCRASLEGEPWHYSLRGEAWVYRRECFLARCFDAADGIFADAIFRQPIAQYAKRLDCNLVTLARGGVSSRSSDQAVPT